MRWIIYRRLCWHGQPKTACAHSLPGRFCRLQLYVATCSRCLSAQCPVDAGRIHSESLAICGSLEKKKKQDACHIDAIDSAIQGTCRIHYADVHSHIQIRDFKPISELPNAQLELPLPFSKKSFASQASNVVSLAFAFHRI